MMGALLGGISFHKGLGVVHSLSHALGSEGRAHHGTLNAILLPHALRFNREAAEARLADLAARLGLGRGGDGPGHLITLTELVLARLPLPRRLGQVEGLRRDRIAEYARLAMLDHCHRTNPRPCTQADMEGLLDGPGDAGGLARRRPPPIPGRLFGRTPGRAVAPGHGHPSLS